MFSCNKKTEYGSEIETILEQIRSLSEYSKCENEAVMTSASSIEASKCVTINGIKFKFVEKESTGVSFVSTKDKKFRTPEGYYVGTKRLDILQNDIVQIQTERGYGHFIALKSGWKLGFCEGGSCTSSDLKDTSEVKWIMVRK
ncbi:hypothetical protein PK35_09690 [Tamlana nanhaiensis]|uniref:Uncharacterized protein n=2 Tax=Neotamlana nanhaiensis TaxID=1382798 RepID=A0A0D7W0B5_9FLAO|nr:hypothetical protein PK35_09690 [Tamlana nanhaiensis]